MKMMKMTKFNNKTKRLKIYSMTDNNILLFNSYVEDDCLRVQIIKSIRKAESCSIMAEIHIIKNKIEEMMK